MQEDADALENELLALRAENRDLRLRAGAAMTADDDALIFEEFLGRLGEVLAMRDEGRSDAATFDLYTEALVQLTDDCLKEMYTSPHCAHPPRPFDRRLPHRPSAPCGALACAGTLTSCSSTWATTRTTCSTAAASRR